MMSKCVIIIGCGFAGLSAASFMASAGWNVVVLEKHATPGGRARQLCEGGFKFDMGPSWYWMPDVFERFFAQFGKSTSDYYQLHRLDPSYRVYWSNDDTNIPADFAELKLLFEQYETGAGKKLEQFLNEAAFKYRVGINKLAFKPGKSLGEFLDWDFLKGIFYFDVFSSVKKHVSKYFKHPRLRLLMEFPVLFLGELPEHTPALYTLMNYADAKLGTWFPKGGMYSVVDGMYQLAKQLGVNFVFNEDVSKIALEKYAAKKVITQNGKEYEADVVIGAADYQFIESNLLSIQHRSYSDNYWNSRKLAPGCLLYYVGLDTRIENISHHSLFFDTPFDDHAQEIYIKKKWPTQPLFYVSAASVSDRNLAPDGCENLFFLIPVAAGLDDDTPELREKYFNIIAKRFSDRTGVDIFRHIVYKKSFAQNDFVKEYNSFKGNAYGLANTLKQTAFWKPACRSKKVKNLFYTGQLTVPGPGVPPSLISGELVAGQVLKYFG
jgi:phytoene desaturase